VGGLQFKLHRIPPTQQVPARTVSQLKAAVRGNWCQRLLCGLSRRSLLGGFAKRKSTKSSYLFISQSLRIFPITYKVVLQGEIMIFRPLISLFMATFFLANQSAPVGAETFSLPFGERVVVAELPIGCLLTESSQGSYDCQYSTTRNMLGGSHDELSEIIVAAKEVNPSEIIDFGENLSVENAQNPDVVSGVALADASQKYILGTDHPVSRSAVGMFEHLSLVGKLGDNNSLVVSQNRPWGGSDCRIFVTGTAIMMQDSSLLGVEQGGMRCILWSYLNGEDTFHALDVLVEVREWDDFQPNGSEAFTSFWQSIIESIRFE
jgi:hypothetical protein